MFRYVSLCYDVGALGTALNVSSGDATKDACDSCDACFCYEKEFAAFVWKRVHHPLLHNYSRGLGRQRGRQDAVGVH